MTGLLALLSKLIDRPSTVWRLAWLTFCLIVLCLCGAKPLPKIVSSVLIGVREPQTSPGTDEHEELQDAGPIANFVLPIIFWSILAAVATALLWHR
jgi:hypothetical protein